MKVTQVTIGCARSSNPNPHRQLTDIDSDNCTEDAFDYAIGERERLNGDEKATAYADDMMKFKLELARAVHGVRAIPRTVHSARRVEIARGETRP